MTATKPAPKFWAIALALTAILFVLIESPVLAQGVLFVESDKVGVGVATPAVPLHVQDSDPGFPDLFRLENLGSDFAGFRFTTTGGSIDFNKAAGNTFRLNIVDADSWELQLDPAGNLTIRGSIFTAGSCSGG